MDSMYFDEIYFVRTAVEHIESVEPYEISHPPLGKEIIAASILSFGMSPLGWRLFGAFSGVLMLVVMYIFLKNMFGKTVIATCGTLLLGFDFMRFVQTRIATIDSYTVLFILLAFFFMYRYITTDIEADFRKSIVPLAFSGFFFGLGFATKWTGFYAGAGLLVIYVIRLAQLSLHYSTKEKSGLGAYLMKTLLFSVLFFVIVPAITYYLSYIPYGLARGKALGDGMLFDADFFRIVWGNQVVMFTYHSRLVAVHPFSSVWWQWILNLRPVLYVNSYIGDTRATFGAFGNPVVWWGGFLAMVVMAVRVYTHRDGKALFILIGYIAQLLPWVAVTRILFTYHYFPSTLFLVLALSHILNIIVEREKGKSKIAVYGFTATAGAVFALFYPSLSGRYMSHWYYNNFIKWFDSWPF
jgi:dolichyl-phosphate-mannose--protein O-mannosyl transferase